SGGSAPRAATASRPSTTSTSTSTTTTTTVPPTSATVAPPQFGFAANPIEGAVRARVEGHSWKPGCPVPLEQLRYVQLSYWGFDGAVHRGELVVNADAVDAIDGAFRR